MIDLPHVQKRGANYRYRRKVKPELRAAIGKTEIIFGLGKQDADFVKRYQTAHKAAEELFKEAARPTRIKSLDEPTAIELGRRADRLVRDFGLDPDWAGADDPDDFDKEGLAREVIAEGIASKYPVDDHGNPVGISRDDAAVLRALAYGSRMERPEPTLEDAKRHYLKEKIAGTPDEHRNTLRVNRVVGYGKQFPRILDLLARPELAYIRQEVAPATEGHPRSTVILPGERLLDRMRQYSIDEIDTDEHPHSETIVLKRTKDEDNYWDEGGLEEYEDSEVTHRYRAEVEDINRWLASADLRFDQSGVQFSVSPFDIRARRLRRIFTRGRFDSGGRLFGGFWQALRKAERRQGLWISGEKAVELDYGQAGARILYGMAGHTPPEGDLYAFPGYYQQRPGIKRVMSAITFATSRPTSFPKGTRDLFRRRDKIGEVLTEIERHHPLIKDMLYRGFGHEVQFVESQIIIEVVQTLKTEGVVALPIHDAIMIPSSAVSRAKEVMRDAFHRRSGVEGAVTEERE